MPIMDDLLYESQELTLSNLIRENKFADAAKYIKRSQIMRHEAVVFNPNASLSVGALPISMQISEDPRQRLIVNPDKVGYPNPSYRGADHIFSQSKIEWKAAIHLAAERGLVDIVRLLLNKAKQSSLTDYVNTKDGYGKTPLHYAAISGNEEMIKYLIKVGADPMVKSSDKSLHPWEMLDSKRTYGEETLDLIFGSFSPNQEIANLAQNPLYHAITMDEAAAKNLAFDERLYIDREALIARAREVGNEKLANYLGFAGDLQNVAKKYRISLLSHHSSQEAKNIHYVNLLKETLDLFAKYNSTEEFRQYNAEAIMRLMPMISAIVNNIGYNFREKSYQLIPWQNLESLGYAIGNINSDNSLKLLFEKGLPSVCGAFCALRANLDELGIDGTVSAALPNAATRPELFPILTITDLVADLRSLKRISSFSQTINSIDISQPNSEGRLALVAMVKQLGEFSKHSQQCSNLSPTAKQNFSDIPWKLLENLRNHIAKAPTRPKTCGAYDYLLQTTDESILLKLKADISDIALQAEQGYGAISVQISTNGWGVKGTHFLNKHYSSNLSTNSVS